MKEQDAGQQSTAMPRKPWVALALSLATPGLGHLYGGRPLKAVLLMAICWLMAPAWIIAAYLQPNSTLLVCLLASLPGVVVVSVYALVDAYRLARREGAHYQLTRCNRASTYVLFFALSWLAPVVLTHAVGKMSFQAFYIPSMTMYPNLRPGDFLLANKRVFTDRAPQSGDVVVFRNPENAAQWKVKRVIAGPEDIIEIRADRVYLNGAILHYDQGNLEPEHADSAIVLHERHGDAVYPVFLDQRRAGQDLDATRVPADHYYLLGDNRTKSRDSRHFGPVPGSAIIGAVHYIHIPGNLAWDRFGAFPGGRL